jgi:uncharacterized membrane protein (DUF485 family)
MAFQEKSAWIMALALLAGGVFYFALVASLSSEAGALAPPLLPQIIAYTAVLVGIAILGHIVAAAMKPREANSDPDERERLIVVRAGHLSSYILGVGVLLSLGMYLFGLGGNALFYGVFGSLMLAQLGEYLLRIFFYRRGF